MSSQCLELKSLKRSETCILNGNGYIPKPLQNARFRTPERFMFKALWWHNGCSIISHRNDEVLLLKRFCDGAKNDLRGDIYLNNGVTIV